MSALTFQDLRGPDALSLLPELAELRITVFKDYPYLYAGSHADEAQYLQRFFSKPEGLVVACHDGDRLVGASTALPLKYESEDIQAPFLQAGIDVNKVMYFGESVLLPAYRGRGIGKIFFHHRLQYAARTQGMEWASFCAVVRPEDHQKRPSDYRHLDGLWQSFGFKKKEGMLGKMSWQDSGDDADSTKPMQFWLRPIVPIRTWENPSSTRRTSSSNSNVL